MNHPSQGALVEKLNIAFIQNAGLGAGIFSILRKYVLQIPAKNLAHARYYTTGSVLALVAVD